MRYDAIRAVAELAASRHGVTTRLQAAHLGISPTAISTAKRRGIVTEPHPGVLVFTAAPPTWRQALAAASLASGGGLTASHRAASVLHDLDGFAPGELELSVESARRARVAGTIVHHVHALDPSDVVTIDGIRTTGLARTLCDPGSVVPPDLVERALDDARRRGASLRWIRRTAERLHRPGQAGTRVLLGLLAAAERQPTVRGSWFEKLVELCLAHPDLPPLHRQYRVSDATGGFVARVDLAFPSLKLAVEAHSREFHFGATAEAADENRDNRLSMVGWDVLYVGYQGTRDPAAILRVVVATAAGRAALLGQPWPARLGQTG